MYHLRFLSLALLVGALGSTGCPRGGPPNTDEGERPGLDQPPAEAQPMRYLTHTYSSGMTTRQRLVIRDAATWSSVWQQITSPRQPLPARAGSGGGVDSAEQPVPAAPAVDFASQVVIVAAMGTKSSGGYAIDIDDVRIVDEAARITVTEQSPGNSNRCGVTMAQTEPVAVVAVTRFPGEATFLERTSQDACE